MLVRIILDVLASRRSLHTTTLLDDLARLWYQNAQEVQRTDSL